MRILRALGVAIFLILASCEAPTSIRQSPPPTPSGLSVTAADGQVQLSWTVVSSATSYNIYKSTDQAQVGTKAGTIYSNSYLDSSVLNGSIYYYRITSVSASGESVPSAQIVATPQVAKSGAPTGLTLSPQEGKISLVWDRVQRAVSYNVYRSTTAGSQGTKVNPSEVSTNSYVDTSVTAGQSYFYQVTAVNGGGESSPSTQVGGMSQVIVADAPTGLSAVSGNKKVTLSWSPTAGASSYSVYRSVLPGLTKYRWGTQLATVSAPGYTDTSVSNMTTYYYVVTANNPGGESESSHEASALPMWSITVSGVMNDDSWQRVPGYWQNGRWTELPVDGPSTFNTTKGIVRDGANLVIIGRNGTAPGYWYNGVWKSLDIHMSGRQAMAVCVNNGDIYVAGEGVDHGLAVAGYWKNGTWTEFPTEYGGFAKAIIVSNGTVYVGGEVYSAVGGGATSPGYWVDGVWTSLPQYQNGMDTVVTSIAVSGLDIFVGGYGFSRSYPYYRHPMLWKNGTPLDLYSDPYVNPGTYVNAITTAAGVLYAGGGGDDGRPAQWWFPAPSYIIQMNVTVQDWQGEVTGLTAFDGHVFSCGSYYVPTAVPGNIIVGMPFAGYWVDSSWYPLSEISTVYGRTATGIIVE